MGGLGYSLVEMAFLVEQGVGGFGQGVISPPGQRVISSGHM